MKKTQFLFLFFVLLFAVAPAQQFQLTNNSEVSILTMGPGTELNDSFGHSAYRIKDVSKGIDKVFNYGEFDFDTPNFYLKFAQGKLLYQIGSNDFLPFFNYYVNNNREVKEQILNINLEEKQTLFNYLLNNTLPENRSYKYDFFFDNCATKIRDVLVQTVPDKIEYNQDFVKENKSFRQLINQNISWNSWGSFGINTALGAVIDKKANSWEYQFLPEYVFRGAAEATIIKSSTDETSISEKQDLVLKTNILFSAKPVVSKNNFFTSPFLLFLILALIIILITITDWRKDQRSRFLDTTIFFVTGSVGLFLFLLWFATDHTATANNYNLLWAFPINFFVVIAFSRSYTKLWMRQYVIFCILMLVLLTVHWISGVETFSFALIPLLLALLIRYIFLVLYIKKNAVTPLQPVLG